MAFSMREKKFTNQEFSELERYSSGRLDGLSVYFMWLTEAQVEKLHSDDWSYYHELQEESRVLWQQAKEEFGFS